MIRCHLVPLVAVFVLAAAQPAAAYIDPGNTSMLLQLVVGSVAAGMVLGRRLWRGAADRIIGLFRSAPPDPSDPAERRRSNP